MRQYIAIANVLYNKKVLDKYTCGSWFLEGLPEKVQKKLVRKFYIKEELPDALDFMKIVKEVLDLHEDNISAKGFLYNQARQSALSELINRNQEPGLEPMKEKGLIYIPPVIPAAGRSTGTEIDGLTEAFKAIVLALSTGNAGGFNPAAGLNQPRDSKGEA